jgi:hypothetical protein
MAMAPPSSSQLLKDLDASQYYPHNPLDTSFDICCLHARAWIFESFSVKTQVGLL